MVPVRVIKTALHGLAKAVCHLYGKWRAGPKAEDPELGDTLLTVVQQLKWLLKDLDRTSGTDDQLELLIEQYDKCRDQYAKLSMRLKGTSNNEEAGKSSYFSDEMTIEQLRNRIKSYKCYCTQITT